MTVLSRKNNNNNSERDSASSDYSNHDDNRKLMYKSSSTIELLLNVDGHVENDYFQNNNSTVDEIDIPGETVQCEKVSQNKRDLLLFTLFILDRKRKIFLQLHQVELMIVIFPLHKINHSHFRHQDPSVPLKIVLKMPNVY